MSETTIDLDRIPLLTYKYYNNEETSDDDEEDTVSTNKSLILSYI